MESERVAIQLDDDDQTFLHATWSRSGKRVIDSVGAPWDEAGQVELTPDRRTGSPRS